MILIHQQIISFIFVMFACSGHSFSRNYKSKNFLLTKHKMNYDISCKLNTQKTEKSETETTNAMTMVKPFSVRFYTHVTSETCSRLVEVLISLDIRSKQTEIIYGTRLPIELHLQSTGGELMPTFYVCDLIKNLDTPVHIYIDGFVASAASLIAICGDKRFMTKNSCILVHQLRAQTTGKLSEMRQELSNFNQFMDNLRNIYLENSNVSIEELDELLNSEVWLSSQKCLDLGFVDEIIQS